MYQEQWNDIIEMYGSEQPLKVKYTFFYHTLHRVCTEKLRGLTVEYNDFFSRLQAVCRQTNYRLFEVDRFRWRARHVMQGDEIPVSDVYETDVRAFVEAYAHFTQSPIPDELSKAIKEKLDVRKPAQEHQPKGVGDSRYRSMRFVACSKDNQYIYSLCRQKTREDLWKIDFSQNEQTVEAAAMLEDGMQFNAVTCTMDEQSGIVVPEMLIIEPDYLVDVTSVCRCMKAYGHSPLNYLLDKLSDDVLSKAIILGNIAGQFLDDCINHPQATYLESMRKSFKANMVEITACEDIDAAFFNDCKKQFDNIRRTIDQLFASPDFLGAEGHVQLEPSFFCEALGIQGRFDFMQDDYKNLIEMKSGQWDHYHQTAKPEHIMQMILYKEILYHNLGIPQSSVNGYIFYSRYPMLQEQRTAREMVRQMMSIRNSIVTLERNVRDGKVRDYLEHLTADDLNQKGDNGKLWTDYNKPDLEALLRPIQDMDGLTADYFYTFFTFVAREQYMAKVGDNRPDSTRGMASLWNADLETKIQNGDIMIDLTLSADDDMWSCESISHITLLKPVETAMKELPPNFRVGDPVILYQRNKPSDNAVTCQVQRCTVEGFDNDTLTLLLNHPQSNMRWFSPKSHYAVEHDYMDASMRQHYKGLYAFLKVSQRRRDLLLGRRKPEVDHTLILKGNYPSPQIANIVLQAKQAQDYFLLVGPPGTGKTSIALKAMVEECLLEHQSLLLLAYTNRAVDEICDTLHDLPYIRVGRELSCDPAYRSHLLEMMVGDDVNRHDVRTMLQNIPILVGTVSSVQSHRELFKFRQFDVAIFDEASQILEPQLLGLLCDEHNGVPSIGKFIMIGDHKQLPAVVAQEEEMAKVDSAQLKAIGLTNCSNSLFERLFRMATHSSDRCVTAFLDLQGRMHPEIAAFVNRMFYDERLKPVGLKHQKENLCFPIHTQEESFVATTRFGFIDIPLPSLAERQPKMNLAEAHIISVLVKEIIHLADENHIPFDTSKGLGIIVPFRRQIVAVRQALYAQGIKDVDKMMIDTVERYQGSQRDVIIYGTTVTRPYELETLSNIIDVSGSKVDRKLNVAVTRARCQLFVLGNRQLLNRNPVYRELINYAEQCSLDKQGTCFVTG